MIGFKSPKVEIGLRLDGNSLRELTVKDTVDVGEGGHMKKREDDDAASLATFNLI